MGSMILAKDNHVFCGRACSDRGCASCRREGLWDSTAAAVFDVDRAAVTAEMRARSKTINFATIYGQGPVNLNKGG